jgi:signal recognition particle GTPase
VESLERLAKKQKRDEGSRGGEAKAEKDKEDGEVFVSWKEQVQNMSREEFEAFLKAKAGEILDKAAETVIEDLADKVMGEADVAVQEVEKLVEGEMVGEGAEVAREERLLVAAAVPEATRAQIRASPRLQRSKDEHTLAKAKERVSRRNLELSEGTSSPAPLFSVNRDLAITCLQQLGINLGNSSVENDKNLIELLGVGVGEGVGGGE